MDILSALKTEASKLQQQLDTLNSAIKALGGNFNLADKTVTLTDHRKLGKGHEGSTKNKVSLIVL